MVREGKDSEGPVRGVIVIHRGASLWSLIWILLLCFFSTLAYGLLIPSVPSLLQQFFHHDVQCSSASTSAGNVTKACDEAGARAALYTGATDGVGAVVTFLLTSATGLLSDSYGRKATLNLLCLFNYVQPLFLYLYAAYQWHWAVWAYLVARGLLGVTRTPAILLAAVGDVAGDDAAFKPKAVGMFFGVMASSFALGPALSLVLPVKWLFLAVLSSLLCLSVSACCMRETLPKHLAAAPKDAWAKIKRNPLLPLKVLFVSKMWWLLAIVHFFVYLPMYGVSDSFAFFYQNKWGGGSHGIAMILIVFGVSGMFCQTIVLNALLYCFSTLPVLHLALFCISASYILQAFCSQNWQFLALVGLNALGFTGIGLLASLVSSITPPSEQGAVQGAFQAVATFGQALGPLLLGLIFKESSAGGSWPYFPGMVFVVASAFTILAMLCSTCLHSPLAEKLKDMEKDGRLLQ